VILATSSASSRSRSGLRAAVLLIAVGVSLAMALAEGILRFFPSLLSVELQQVIEEDPDNFGVAHPYIGYLHTPNQTYVETGKDFRAVVNTDGYGFRNSWPWPERAEIVAVGDSVVFGYGVEHSQAWPTILEKNLPGNHLINLGLVGAGSQQYLRLFETFGTRLHPKLLLVGFLVRNDFSNDYMFDRWLKSGAGGNFKVWQDFGRPASTRLAWDQPVSKLLTSLLWRVRLLASKSRLFNLLLYIRSSLKSGPKEIKIFQAPDGSRLELDVKGFINQTKDAQPGSRGFDVNLDALRRICSIAKTNNTKVLVIFQPSKEEVYLPLMGETNVDTDPGRPLRTMLKKLGIPYLDLLPAFRERAAKGEVLFFETDGHPNARGYALIAQLVREHLRTNAKVYALEGSAEK
jgi:lysophospholipase L1-like esterase